MITKRKRGRPKGTAKEPTKQIRVPIKLIVLVKYIIDLFKTKK